MGNRGLGTRETHKPHQNLANLYFFEPNKCIRVDKEKLAYVHVHFA
jgi:hypothetical protein